MLGAREIVKEAESLPVEERAFIIDLLLRTLNSPEQEVDQKWIKLAKQRLNEIRSGQITAIPGDEVFAEIRERFDW
ncbi:addiction module protein [Candidatus Fermentibacteria bacterium]|nr:MAG: addiction module protein [Candidatus Fermentibacteria bacterium]